MDENLAELLAYGESNSLQDVASQDSENCTIRSSNPSLLRPESGGAPSALRSSGDRGHISHGSAKQLFVTAAQRPQILRHAETTPNLFSSSKQDFAGFDALFLRMGSDPQTHDCWGILDDNFVELFAYSAAKSNATTAETAPSNTHSRADENGTGQTASEQSVIQGQSSHTPISVPAAPAQNAQTSPGLDQSQACEMTTKSEKECLATLLAEPPAETKESDSPHGAGQDQRAKGARPKYADQCCNGWATDEVRKFWFAHKSRTVSEANKAARDAGMSLVASTNPDDPIYYWQLFSVLGEQRIERLVRAFYENVYADDDPLLRRVFQRLPGRSGLDHHVRAQTAFWIDAFGGGRRYAGGWDRVEFHHRYGAGEIMNVEGATRWAYHMNCALMSADLTDDPRVRACLVDFLKTHMDKYGDKFKFDTSQIRFGDTGFRGAVKSLNRAMSQAGSVLGSMFKSKHKPAGKADRTSRELASEGKKGGAQSRWALVRSAVRGPAGRT